MLGAPTQHADAPRSTSFLVLFFKKELLSSPPDESRGRTRIRIEWRAEIPNKGPPRLRYLSSHRPFVSVFYTDPPAGFHIPEAMHPSFIRQTAGLG
jgi:hypothetical protein